jgi:Fe-S cluster assembly ATP-binding protein
MGLLELEQVTLRLDGGPILDELSLDVWEGHVHAIVGPNGAGKSTLAYTVMGLDGYRHIEGDIRFAGRSVREMAVDERARLGITLGWQEPARFEGLPVRTFLSAGAKDKSDDALRDCLSKVDLNPSKYLDRAVDKTLSGGERKRVELASILAMQPKLVLLDEPDSGIDVAALERMGEAIRVLSENGCTVVLITHSLEVLRWAEHAFLLCHGQLLDKGSVDKISQYFKDKCIPCDHKNMPQLDSEASA